MKGGRKLSAWNLFVKKIYSEGKKSNKDYSFKQALSDASSRKSEMGNMSKKHMGNMSNMSNMSKKQMRHMSKKHMVNMSKKSRMNRTHRRR